MTSSKLTTWCGAVAVVGSIVATYNFSQRITQVASCIASIGGGLGLFFARDNKVSDEQAGAGQKKEPTPTP